MTQKTYTITPAETLTLTVDRPTTITVTTIDDFATIYDRTEAQTLDDLRRKIIQLSQTNAALHRELDQYRD